MIVKELIEKLKTMPEDSRVLYFYDSAPRGTIDDIVLNKQNVVILYDEYWGKPRDENLETWE